MSIFSENIILPSGEYKIKVDYDNDCNPREWDNLGTMLTAHRRYSLGDEQFSDTDSIVNCILDEIDQYSLYSELEELAEERYSNYKPYEKEDGVWVLSTENGNVLDLSYEYDDEDEALEALSEFKDDFACHEWKDELSYDEKMKIANKYAYILPLYLYDHSGITMNTTGFSCGWDSGQVGEIFITHQKALKECPMQKDETIEQYENRIIEYLRNEVQVYDQYLTGDVYWYEIDKISRCECCDNVKDEENLQSCGGFFGQEFLIDEMVSCFDKDERDEVRKLIESNL